MWPPCENSFSSSDSKIPDAPKRDPKEFVDGSIIERLKQEKFVEGLKF
jgi:hypothetical protein